MKFHWDRGFLLQQGYALSDELPPAGAIAEVFRLPNGEYQVTWLGARSVQDFLDRPSAQYATQDAAIAIVEAEVRAGGHIIGGV